MDSKLVTPLPHHPHTSALQPDNQEYFRRKLQKYSARPGVRRSRPAQAFTDLRHHPAICNRAAPRNHQPNSQQPTANMGGKKAAAVDGNSKKAQGQSRKAEAAANKKAAEENKKAAVEDAEWEKGSKKANAKKSVQGFFPYIEVAPKTVHNQQMPCPAPSQAAGPLHPPPPPSTRYCVCVCVLSLCRHVPQPETVSPRVPLLPTTRELLCGSLSRPFFPSPTSSPQQPVPWAAGRPASPSQSRRAYRSTTM